MNRKLAKMILSVIMSEDMRKTMPLPLLTNEDIAREYQHQWHKAHRAKGDMVTYECLQICKLGSHTLKSDQKFDALDKPNGKSLISFQNSSILFEVPTKELDALLESHKIDID